MLGVRPALETLAQTRWDLIVIGGGVTGAGVALEAARRANNVLLLEQKDFAWGASSRSSKMVHGGLRYLAEGRFGLTRDALRERERMARELPDLVIRQPYAFVVRAGEFPGRWPMKAALWLYDFLAGIRDHRWLGRERLLERIPGLAPGGLRGAMIYTDALTDDARLVLRILHEAAAEGARLAKLYPRGVGHAPRRGVFANRARRNRRRRCDVDGSVGHRRRRRGGRRAVGRAEKDQTAARQPSPHPARSSARGRLRDGAAPEGQAPGLHLPLAGHDLRGHDRSRSFRAPLGRAALHGARKWITCSRRSAASFRRRAITPADVVSSMAGVRPVIASGKGLNPSQESREHSVWRHDGMVCVAGGKLTTFRLIALDALRAADLIDEQEHVAARATRRTAVPLAGEVPLSPRPSHGGAARRRGADRNASLGAR